MNFLKGNWLSIVILILVVGWLMIYGVSNQDKPAIENNQTNEDNTTVLSSGNIKALAQCLTDKGFKLYGTFWCSHCKEQKDLFGDAVSLVNYIECSTPDGQEQTEVCKQANIESYPTWEFPNGQKVVGVLTLENLIKASSCPIK